MAKLSAIEELIKKESLKEAKRKARAIKKMAEGMAEDTYNSIIKEWFNNFGTKDMHNWVRAVEATIPHSRIDPRNDHYLLTITIETVPNNSEPRKSAARWKEKYSKIRDVGRFSPNEYILRQQFLSGILALPKQGKTPIPKSVNPRNLGHGHLDDNRIWHNDNFLSGIPLIEVLNDEKKWIHYKKAVNKLVQTV